MKRLFLAGILPLALAGCGPETPTQADGYCESLTYVNMGATMDISGTDKNVSISGSGSIYTFKENSSFCIITISAINTMFTFEQNVSVAGKIQVVGSDNTIFAPVGNGYEFEITGSGSSVTEF